MPQHIHAKKRLVILANHRQARLVLAKGIKIHDTLSCLSNREELHSAPLSHHGVGHDKGHADTHFFPDHKEFRMIEKESFAHEITKEVLRLRPEYDEEVILVCEPKMLGLLKKEIERHRPLEVYKTLSLDCVEIDSAELEKKLLDA